MLSTRNSLTLRRLYRYCTRDISLCTTASSPRQPRPHHTHDPLQATPLHPHDKTVQHLASPPLAPLPRQSKMAASDTLVDQALDLSRVVVNERPLAEGSEEAQALYRTMVDAAPDALLRIVSAQHNRLNKVHFALAMKRLFRIVSDLEKDELVEFKTELHEQKGFQVLCALVALKGQHYEGDVAADMLRFMCVLGLDSHHPALQVYLQLIKYHLNDLHLDVLVRLSYSLSGLTVTSQTELVRRAVTVLVNLREPQVPALNTWQVVTLLEQFGETLSPPVLRTTLKTLSENILDVSARLSTAALRGLSAAGPDALSDPAISGLAADVITVLTGRLHQSLPTLPVADVISVLGSLSELGVYDLDLFNEIGGCIPSDANCTVKNILNVLTHFRGHSYQHGQLVETFKQRLETEDLTVLDREEVVSVLGVLAETSRPAEVLDPASRPEEERKMIERLKDRLQELDPNMTTEEHRQTALDLSVLSEVPLSRGHGTPAELNEPTDGLPTSHDIPSLLLSHQKSLKNSYMNHEKDVRVLGKALSRAINHCQSVQPSVESDISHFIDFIVRVDSDGNPLPIAQSNSKALPVGTQSVAVVVLHDNSFHRNTGQLRGYTLLCGKLLQRQGYLPLFINYDEWHRMDEEDMVPYLLRRITTTPDDQHLHML